MTYEERQALTDKFFEECKKIMLKKGPDYTVNGQAFKDCDETADDIGCSPLAVLWIGFRKHLAAVKNFIKYGKVESEPIDGRLMDAANYLSLMYAKIEYARTHGEQLSSGGSNVGTKK